MESVQGNLVIWFMGLGKRSRHSNLLCALQVPSIIGDVIKQKIISLGPTLVLQLWTKTFCEERNVYYVKSNIRDLNITRGK